MVPYMRGTLNYLARNRYVAMEEDFQALYALSMRFLRLFCLEERIDTA
jgi:hypothetical protein